MKTLLEYLNEVTVTESSNWGGLNDADDKQWDVWFNEYVPASGKCDTIGGEILRAMSRLVYRFYNDGDTVEEYGGSEYNHCRAADMFLRSKVKGYKTLEGIWDENKYEKELCARLKFVFDYLNENPDVFNQKNDEDYLDLSPYEPYRDEDEDDDWNEDENDDIDDIQ